MHIVERLERLDHFYGRVGLTIGNFEGFHKGHQEIVTRLVAESRKRGLHTSVITFKQHPLALLTGREPPRLWSPTDKIIRLRDAGIDLLVYIDFSAGFAALSPVEFVRTLAETLGPKLLCLGGNFRFGRGNQGDMGLLRGLSGRFGYELIELEDLKCRGMPVSSTRIREAVQKGDFTLATELLGRRYSVRLVPEKRTGRALAPVTRVCALPCDGLYRGELEDLLPGEGPRHTAAVAVRVRNGLLLPETGVEVVPGHFYRYFFADEK